MRRKGSEDPGRLYKQLAYLTEGSAPLVDRKRILEARQRPPFRQATSQALAKRWEQTRRKQLCFWRQIILTSEYSAEPTKCLFETVWHSDWGLFEPPWSPFVFLCPLIALKTTIIKQDPTPMTSEVTHVSRTNQNAGDSENKIWRFWIWSIVNFGAKSTIVGILYHVTSKEGGPLRIEQIVCKCTAKARPESREKAVWALGPLSSSRSLVEFS